ncbi:MAG: pyruvate kinase alpha/beta domain-containing protein [Planctomycetota bacterium]
MAEVTTIYHDQEGIQNTDATLAAARRRAKELGVRQLVVATTTGQTAVTCAEMMAEEMDTIVAVMMHAVDYEVTVNRPAGKTRAPNPDLVAQARKRGVKIYRGVHSLAGAVGSAIQGKYGGVTPETLIARTYMTLSTGTKVAVESTLMAADAGYLDVDADVIALGGWRGGADTAVVVKPAFTHTFFDLRIREFIALPRAAGTQG